MTWKCKGILLNILLVLTYWVIALAIMSPVVYLAEYVSPWFWMLMLVAAPLLFVVTVIFSAISDEIEEKRKKIKEE